MIYMSDISDDFLAFYIDTHPAPQSRSIKINEIDYRNISWCEFCNKTLRRRFKVHKNICQDPQEHKFCSRDCKEKWCYNKQKE